MLLSDNVKFMFYKTATKFDKIFTVDFVNFCGLLRKHELYNILSRAPGIRNFVIEGVACQPPASGDCKPLLHYKLPYPGTHEDMAIVPLHVYGL